MSENPGPAVPRDAPASSPDPDVTPTGTVTFSQYAVPASSVVSPPDPELDLEPFKALARTHRFPHRDLFAESLAEAIFTLCGEVARLRAPSEPMATPDHQRLRSQAIVISEMLSDAGIGSCTIVEGVRELIIRAALVRPEPPQEKP